MDLYTFVLAMLAVVGLLGLTFHLTRIAQAVLTLKTAQARADAAKSRLMAARAAQSHAARRKKNAGDEDEDQDDEDEDGGDLPPMLLGLASQLGIDPGKVMAGDPAELAKVQGALAQLAPAGKQQGPVPPGGYLL